MQQGYTHVRTPARLQHTDYLIEVLNHLRGSLWATVGAEGIEGALIDCVVVCAVFESHTQGVHHLVVDGVDTAILHMLDNLLFEIDAHHLVFQLEALVHLF